MKSIIYFCLAAICLLIPAAIGALDGTTLGGVATTDSTNLSDQPLGVTTQPSDYGQMVEMPELSQVAGSVQSSTQMPTNSYNALWVVDSSTGNMNDTLSVPLNSYARVFLTPAQGGNVVIEQLDPNNQLQTSNMGSVEPFHTYGIWFYGGKTGTYQMRYNVNGGEYSNVVEFDVH
jgi:hypothetical protein